jgi:hypothetical protein
MNKMGIAGNRIYFTAYGLELVIDIRQILQFRGAHKGKVRGVKEE